jgi:hypothetical protein
MYGTVVLWSTLLFFVLRLPNEAVTALVERFVARWPNRIRGRAPEASGHQARPTP